MSRRQKAQDFERLIVCTMHLRTNRDIARATGLSKSTVQRILTRWRITKEIHGGRYQRTRTDADL